MKKILITGADGQVGCSLSANAPIGFQAIAANRSVLDITDPEAVLLWVAENNISGIINAAAYTAVDRAEEESSQAFRVNADGPKNLARAAREAEIPLVHISTDFVFDGRKGSPYEPTDPVSPVSVYGESKARGEVFVSEVHPDSAIIRTSWVYSKGYPNFMSTMLRLMKEKEKLSVVADQIGTPTFAEPLALTCWNALQNELSGIFHWSDAGVASWYDFAVAIQEEGLHAGLLERPIPISPIRTIDYPTPAARPPYSVLDKTASWQAFDCPSVHWREALREVLKS